jgi:hypothetical protein
MQTKITFPDGMFDKVRIGHLNYEVELLKKKLAHEKKVKAGYVSAWVRGRK